MALIELEAITKEYQLGRTTVSALRGVNLQVEQGEFTTVAGASGSGKSTLLNLIGCLDTPSSGRILINGQSVGAMSERQLDRFRLRTIGFIFQSFNLIPVLSVALTLWFGARGIYVGPGPISFAMGGERFYPELSTGDVVQALGIILAFAVFATLGPGLRIVHHRVTDLLLNRQRRVSILRAVFRGAAESR